MKRNEQAMTWITSRLWHVAQSHGAKITAINWKRSEQERVFVVEILGNAGKRAAKLFDDAELAQCPLSEEDLVLFDSRLSSLVRFFKAK